MRDVTLLVDGWQVLVAAHELRRGAVTRRLEPKAMQVLAYLAARPGAVVSRAELLDAVWGGAFVGDDALSAAIIKLRKAFGDSARAPRVIETVHRSGYRLVATVDGSERAGDVDGDRPRPRSKVVVGTVLRCVFRIEVTAWPSTDPEQWKDGFDRVVAQAAEIVRNHGGRPIRDSDGLIGVFGAPIAQEHHATRAVQAAMAMRKASTATRPVADGPPVSCRWTLASGEILWADDAEFPVHGMPVQRVGVLSEAAQPGEILLTRETLESARGLTGSRIRQARSLSAEDVVVLDADARWADPWDITPDRRRTPLAGRSREISRIETLIDTARSGRGQVVAVCGPAGSGKSRLAHEALRRLPADECTVRIAAASPLETGTPFYPLRHALMDALRVDSRQLADGEALRRRIEAVEPYDASAVQAVLSPDSCAEDWLHADSATRRDRCLAALSDVLLGGDRFTVLVFEDLQWADDATLAFVDAVVSTVARRPMLVVVTYRPGFADPWAARTYHSLLRAEPLHDSDSLAILDHLAGDDPTVRAWKSAVLARTDGTPLFAEEVVRSARMAGTLQGEPGALRLAHQPSSPSVPASIHAAIGERLDKLGADAQHMLSLAAVIGREIPGALLDALAKGTGVDTRSGLRELVAAELLYSVGVQREPDYVFKHALTQEVAYRAIPPSLRRQHHRQVADLLASAGAALVMASPELVARHRSAAGQHVLAVEGWLQAAHLASTAAAFPDALEHLDRARAALTFADPADQDRLGLAISLAVGSALMQSVGPADEQVEKAYLRARELAAVGGSQQQRFEAGWGLWFVHLMRGDINTAQPLGDELFDLAGELDEATQLEAHHLQWATQSLAGDLDGVRRHTEFAIERYDPDRHHRLTYSYGGHDPGVCALNLSAMALWLQGEPDQAHQRCESAVALAARLGHPYTLLEASNSALTIALLEGDADTLLRHTQAIQDLVAAGKLPSEANAYADGYRANALLFGGDLDTALSVLERAAPMWQAFWGAWCFPLDSAFATALMRSGATDRALTHIDDRLAFAERTGANWWTGEFRRLRDDLVGDHR
ncbi:AAA family ATPase [Hamadaea sp. NPDC051192]|uniref:ATP-binding protein n=1 Tax=Hamadaea sp. NPDC051192 TaxID=3154940 RepID=UPI003420CD15